MAVEKLKKAFISLGKFKQKNSNGVEEDIEKFIVMPEASAKYVGATYLTTPPAPRTVTVVSGKLKGRTYKVEHSTSINGTPYQFGYDAGTRLTGKPAKPKQIIKWISFYIPRGVSLKQFMSIIFSKISKKPILLKTPAGVTTRIQSAK
jgi:hypothetical protein